MSVKFSYYKSVSCNENETVMLKFSDFSLLSKVLNFKGKGYLFHKSTFEGVIPLSDMPYLCREIIKILNVGYTYYNMGIPQERIMKNLDKLLNMLTNAKATNKNIYFNCAS